MFEVNKALHVDGKGSALSLSMEADWDNFHCSCPPIRTLTPPDLGSRTTLTKSGISLRSSLCNRSWSSTMITSTVSKSHNKTGYFIIT
jgi:hypothetical protein